LIPDGANLALCREASSETPARVISLYFTVSHVTLEKR
jgi:hypothetical protein